MIMSTLPLSVKGCHYNTGVLLSKAGESGYSRFRRFLISNQSINVKSADLKKALLNQINDFFLVAQDVNQMAALVYFYQKKASESLGSYNEQKPEFLLNRYKPSKHCQTCAEIGFHSFVFDFPWLKKCPVHGIKLSARCKTCNHSWPATSEINGCKCTSCGKFVETNQIKLHFGFKRDKFEIFSLLKQLYGKSFPYSIPCEFALISEYSVFHISFLVESGLVPHVDLTRLYEAGIPIYGILNFDISLSYEKKSNIDLECLIDSSFLLAKAKIRNFVLTHFELIGNQIGKSTYSDFSLMLFDVLFLRIDEIESPSKELINLYCLTSDLRTKIIELVRSTSNDIFNIIKSSFSSCQFNNGLIDVINEYAFRKVWTISYYLINWIHHSSIVEKYEEKGMSCVFLEFTTLIEKVIEKNLPIKMTKQGDVVKAFLPELALDEHFCLDEADRCLLE